MKGLEECTPRELAILTTAIGIIISSKLNINQQNVVGNFLEGVGQIVLVIAAQAQNLQSQGKNQSGNNGSNNSSGGNADLQKQIDDLKEYIKKFEENMSH